MRLNWRKSKNNLHPSKKTDRIDTTKKIETDRLIVILRDDNIMHVHIKDRVVVDIECQEEMKKLYWELTNERIPFIFTAGEFISLTKEARVNARTMEDEVPVSASALIVTNLAQKLLADFYYKIEKPKQPLKVFRDFDKGIEWLKTI